VEAARSDAARGGVTLTCELAEALPPVRGDAARLQKVVRNLLSNAVKFTPPGGRVRVRVDRAGDEARLVVEDTGIGIAPAFLPHVFDRFRQADSSMTRVHGGLGLGLALARELVELHEGRLSAASPGDGAGATFTVHLPLCLELEVSGRGARYTARTRDSTGAPGAEHGHDRSPQARPHRPEGA
jgi:signal transduction histidine kinase